MQLPNIVLPGKLDDVAIQVLLAHMVTGPMRSPLLHCPKRFNAVGMVHSIHLLGDRILDPLMRSVESVIGPGIVRVHHCGQSSGGNHESFQPRGGRL